MTQQRQSLGKQGEDLACRELRRRGYAILARRYRTRFGEIDVIARDQGSLVFVEVKTRRRGGFGGATAAVGFHKQRRLINMARSYLMGIGGTLPPCRFDVVGVTLAAGGRPVLDVVVNAFVVR
ncbi:MAG: YraN family protein [Acidobacteria bacterium]|nr:YraN family protein [Acidobacteriota bacterium]